VPIPAETYEDLFVESIPVSTPRRRLQLVPEVVQPSQPNKVEDSGVKLNSMREEYEKIIKGQRNELQSLRSEIEGMHQAHIRETEGKLSKNCYCYSYT
jgi:hypothetical protein